VAYVIPNLGGKGAGSEERRAMHRLDLTSLAHFRLSGVMVMIVERRVTHRLDLTSLVHCRLSSVTVTIVNLDGLYAEGGSLRPCSALHRTTTLWRVPPSVPYSPLHRTTIFCFSSMCFVNFFLYFLHMHANIRQYCWCHRFLPTNYSLISNYKSVCLF
jgi:hypothetical protein